MIRPSLKGSNAFLPRFPFGAGIAGRRCWNIGLVLQSGPLQAGRIGLTLQDLVAAGLLLRSARPVLRPGCPARRVVAVVARDGTPGCGGSRVATGAPVGAPALLQPLLVGAPGCCCPRPVWLAWLRDLAAAEPGRCGNHLSLRTGLTRLVATVVQAGIGAAEGALLGDDATAEILREWT